MEEEKLDILPRRSSQQITKFKNADQRKFFTNLYQVDFAQKYNYIYQFVVETTPELPADSADLYRIIFKKIYKELKTKLGDVIRSGTMVWGFKNLTKATIFQCQFKYQQQSHKYDVLVKPVKQIQFGQFLKDANKKQMILQIANSKIKATLRDYMQYVELNPGKYFNKIPTKIEALSLEIRKGYKLTLCPIGNQMLIQIDVCSKISRSHNFLRELQNQNLNQQSANNLYKDATVITRYGKLRTYRIQNINYQLNPASKFYSDKQAGQITYAKYYQVAYGIKVMDMKQPLIYTVSRVEKQIKNEKLEEKPIYCYLIPQLVSLTGMSDQDRANHNSMKQIAPYTKLQPQARAQSNQTLIKRFNEDKNNQLIKIKNSKHVHGAVLKNRIIKLGDATVNTKEGAFNFKNKIFSPANLKDWVIVYSVSNQPDRDDKDADNVFDLIKKSSDAFGIVVNEPGFITVKGKNVGDWKKELQTDFSKNGKPQIVILLFQKYQQKFYGELKRFLTCQKKVPSQAIRRRTLSNPQFARNMSAASKILLQMNAKLGLPLWQISNPSFGGKTKVMYGGISISKGVGGYTLAFVGTIDKTCTKVYSEAVVGIKKKQEIPQTTFDSIFKNWARTYYKNTKSVPDLIIIYRQGLAQAQIQKIVRPQIKSLQKTVQTIGQKVKIKDYNPKLVFIGVNKKISMRFYNIVGKQQQAKFIPLLSNPDSGSVVVQDLSIGNLTDFHMAAQKVTQGTCTPTQYITIYKNCDVNMQQLIEFTYSQCFNYYNWTGAVRVPACLQCADKLAKLVGQSIKDNVKDLGQMDNTYHFL